MALGQAKTNFIDSSNTGTHADLGSKYVTKEYVTTLYPGLAPGLINPALWTWGNNAYGQLGNNSTTNTSSPANTVAGGMNWKQVSCGGYRSYKFSAAIKTDGTLWTWGNNSNGQLGNSTSTSFSSPIVVAGTNTNWGQVACGYTHMAAIKTDGTLWSWGYNGYGQLGDSTSVNKSSPISITTNTNWGQVACGYYHSAAVKTDGTLWSWGYNINGQLGTGDFNNYSSPVTVAGILSTGSVWASVATSDSAKHSLAIKTDGTLWSWGYNKNGQLGNGYGSFTMSPGSTAPANTTWAAVACSYSHLLAIKNDGTLWACGSNSNGQLGIGNTSRYVSIIAGATGTTWSQAMVGAGHSVGIKTDGTLWTWGYNSNGQLGDGTIVNKSSPVTTAGGGTTWAQVSCGYAYIAAVKTDGTLWTWGDNTYGQLGDGTAISKSSPVTVAGGGTNWASISAAKYHTAAVKTDGTLWAWGINTYGQLGTSTNLGAFLPNVSPLSLFGGGTSWSTSSNAVSAGGSQTGAIKTDGTLWTWGNGSYGALGLSIVLANNISPVTVAGGGTNWSTIRFGMDSSIAGMAVATKTDGTLWACGYGLYGATGVGQMTNNSSFVTVAGGGNTWSTASNTLSAGGSEVAAVKTDGTLWTWGYNRNGQLGNGIGVSFSSPSTVIGGGTNWKQASSAEHFSAGIKTDGTLWTWGWNFGGVLGNALPTGGTANYQFSPGSVVGGGTTWKTFTCGYLTSAGIKTDGTLWTWGYNASGELGDGTTSSRSSPVTTVLGGTNWKQVACGYNFTAGITEARGW